jgi:hypothetical protein
MKSDGALSFSVHCAFYISPPYHELRIKYASYHTQSSINSTDFDDPNIDPSHIPEFDDESPYPEVRSAVANTDDQSIPTTTLRTWVLGLAWAIVMPGVNQFFFFRYPSVPITGIVAQLLSFPIGRLWAAYVPRKRIFGISLNPGPFTIKEHVLITVGPF